MASKKKSEGSGIQQAAGLIRYFDEESEHAWKITPMQVYSASGHIALTFLVQNPMLAPMSRTLLGVKLFSAFNFFRYSYIMPYNKQYPAMFLLTL